MRILKYKTQERGDVHQLAQFSDFQVTEGESGGGSYMLES